MAANPPDVDSVSLDDLDRLGMNRRTGALYWDGAQVVTRSVVRLGKPELWLAFFATVGTFGTFMVELWKAWHG